MLLQGKYYDLDVFSRFQSGDELAFRQLFNHYQPMLYAKVRKFCRQESEAEEVTQEAFVQLYLKRQTLTDPHGIFPFLLVVARRLAISLFRKYMVQQQFQDEAQLSWQEEHLHLQQEMAYKDLYDILQQTINQLPPQQQLIYRMNKLEQLSYAEIAEHVGLSKNTVRNHLNLACKFVRFRVSKIIGFLFLISFLIGI